MANAREKILEKIEKILVDKRKRGTLLPIPEVDLELNVFGSSITDNIQYFVDELKKVNGEPIICEDEADLIRELQTLFQESNWKSIYCKDLEMINYLEKANIAFEKSEDHFLEMEAGLINCEFAIARTGSLMVSSRMASGRRMNVYPPVLLVIAKYSQLVSELEQAYAGIAKKYAPDFPSMITLVTGPSRTADIEKTLVIGAHGPKRLIIFLLKNN